MMTHLAFFAPSTSTPSSFASGMTLEAVMVQLQRMDARLDTLPTKMYQVNTCAGRIARRQARLGGFVESPFPSPKASEDEDSVGDFDSDADATADEDASSSKDDEMTASQ